MVGKQTTREIIGTIILGRIDRDNAQNRHAWVIKSLKELPVGVKILDAGAGECRYKPYCKHLKYVAQDFCEYQGIGDSHGLNYGLQTDTWDTSKIDIVSDIISIPVEDSSFDAVLCTEVLEHIPYPELAIKEFARILKKDGVLILTAPFNSLTHFAPYHFCTGFNRFWYEKHLPDHGFEIVECERNGNYFSYMLQETERTMGYARIGTAIRLIVGGRIFVSALRSLSKSENNRGDMGCFGYHIKAKKL